MRSAPRSSCHRHLIPAVVVLSLLAACRRTPSPEPAGVAAAPVPATQAEPHGPRLAYATGRSLCVQRLAPDTLPPRTCTELPDTIEQLAWVNRGDLAVLLASGGVVLAGERGVRALPSPPEATWDRPPPRDTAGHVALGAERRSDKRHLFVSGGEVWLAKCPWWFVLDAGGCHEWVSARLTPPAAVKVERAEPPGFREQVAARFDAVTMGGERPRPPADVSLTIDGARLVCQRGGVRGVFVPEIVDPVPEVSWSWVPGSASFYLLTVTHDYLEVTHASTYWMKACDAKPVRELSGIVIGSGGFWGHQGEAGWVVRSGDRELGVIDGALPAFAPSR